MPEISLRTAVAVFIASLAAALGAYLATPRLTAIENAPDLESTVPRAFGDWVEVKLPFAQVSLSTGGETDINQPYDQTVMRTYRNGKGQLVQLALAWGANQRQEVKIHRPDLCYAAQGFRVKSLIPSIFAEISTPSGDAVRGKHMIAESKASVEAVTYWIRIGNLYSEDAIDTRLGILREGLAGRIPDGILVRASISGRDASQLIQSFPLMDKFLAELVASLPPRTRALLVR